MAIEVTPAIEVRKKLTADEVEAMSLRGEFDGIVWELVDGELIELAGNDDEHDNAAGNIHGALWTFARRAGGRAVGATLAMRVGPNRANVRIPDAGYIAPKHAGPLVRRFRDGAADLMVEVLSEGQYGEAYAKGKVREYFEAGARLVWLVDLRRQEVRVYSAGSDTYTVMRRDAVLSLEPIIEGFALTVAEIFS